MPGIVEVHPTTHIIEVSTVMCHDIVDIPHTLTGTVQSSVAMGGLTLGPNQCTVGTGAAAEGSGGAIPVCCCCCMHLMCFETHCYYIRMRADNSS